MSYKIRKLAMKAKSYATMRSNDNEILDYQEIFEDLLVGFVLQEVLDSMSEIKVLNAVAQRELCAKIAEKFE